MQHQFQQQKQQQQQQQEGLSNEQHQQHTGARHSHHHHPQQQPDEPQARQQQQRLEEQEQLDRDRERAQAEVTEALRETMRATRPKGIKQGLSSGAAAFAGGIAAGIAGLVVAPVAGARQEGAAGFAKGLATGVAGAVALPLAGVAAGVVQVGRGVVNSVEAIDAKKAGKVWNKESRAWEEPPGSELTAYDADVAAERAALRGDRPAVDYYALLEGEGGGWVWREGEGLGGWMDGCGGFGGVAVVVPILWLALTLPLRTVHGYQQPNRSRA